MAHYNTILNELLNLIPRHRFETLVKDHGSDRYVKRFDSWNQLTVLLYAQASGKDSLRDIEQAFRLNAERLYHLGLTSIKRSTLADANQKRDFQIFEGLFYRLLERCREISPKHSFRFKNPLYTIDATIIELCLSVFPWARYQRTKGALKLHYRFDHAGHLPSFMVMTEGRAHELPVTRKNFELIPDSIYCLDRGYIDFAFFREIQEGKSTFVTRAKNNLDYAVVGQHTQDHKKGVLSDQVISLRNSSSSRHYPDVLRLVRYFDKEQGREIRFLTNNFHLSPLTIAQVYKERWQVEVFFKWIKQNLKIKTFLGTSKNAVLTQIWVAMIYYLLLAYVKFQTRYRQSLFYLHRAVRETLLSRCSIIDLLRASEKLIPKLKEQEVQFSFW